MLAVSKCSHCPLLVIETCLWLLGDGVESRHEYTEFVCATSPALYQLSHYLFDEYDMNGDHHLRKEDYDTLHVTMDSDSTARCFYFCFSFFKPYQKDMFKANSKQIETIRLLPTTIYEVLKNPC